jgi:hypothetical protein
MGRVSRGSPWFSAVATLVCGAFLAACGGSSAVPTASPTPNLVTTNYVALVHNYWLHYKAAEGDPPSFAQVCGYFSTGVGVDSPACLPRIAAILPPHETFLSDLDTTPAPPQFAADDHAFRTHLPIAIAHLKAAMAAAGAGNALQVSDEFTAYVTTMQDLFANLDHVDPSFPHD